MKSAGPGAEPRRPGGTMDSSLSRVRAFSEGGREMRRLLGGKGANIAEMTRLGLPVPQGFTVTTAACIEYLGADGVMPEGLWSEIDESLARLEHEVGQRLGDGANPLLVSVRSGAAISMPGMMDTVLNLGLNATSREGLAARTGNRRFALDSHRRLVQMFADVVRGVPRRAFEDRLRVARERASVGADIELSVADLEAVVEDFLAIYSSETGEAFPDDPRDQLRQAVEAVFRSWQGRRARDYRRAHGIANDLGTAVNVQRMVFGNTGERSATGVAFTRDNVTGEPHPVGEFLVNAQGEDVVAGIRTPRPLDEMAALLPEAHAALLGHLSRLEAEYHDMQDVEFTVQEGELFVLQTRSGKRSAVAMARIAVDMVAEGLVSERDALATLVDPGQVPRLLVPQIDPASEPEPIGHGVAASPGAGTGAIALSADAAAERGAAGEAVILVRDETTPDDFHGMLASRGILTARGGKTSHAAIVAVGMGTPAVCGLEAMRITDDPPGIEIGGHRFAEGDPITINGTNGRVYAGALELAEPDPEGSELATLLEWADRARALGVRANADTPEDAARARALGAEGIGLCRTEHMFGAAERLPVVREMIMAADDAAAARALATLRGFQEEDFRGIFEAMAGLPVTIRLLDPPLHEFLPSLLDTAVAVERAEARGEDDAEARRELERVSQLHEVNPMLGTRGVRLGLTRPGIYRMQVAAILTAASRIAKETGAAPEVEIMIPLVGFAEELRLARRHVEEVAVAVAGEQGIEVPFRIGTMIEVPRAALAARQIAAYADFFSFGTNDLTQMTLGFSRDDAEAGFMEDYLERGLLVVNPFETIDPKVAELVRLSVGRGRAGNPDLHIGVCGEHGGDPDSIGVLSDAGLDYVSCSPFRVQTARIAAGVAASRAGGGDGGARP